MFMYIIRRNVKLPSLDDFLHVKLLVDLRHSDARKMQKLENHQDVGARAERSETGSHLSSPSTGTTVRVRTAPVPVPVPVPVLASFSPVHPPPAYWMTGRYTQYEPRPHT
jgi:hypothetical protein